MQETSTKDEPSGAIAIVEFSNDRAHAHDEKDLQRGDPCDGTGRVFFQEIILIILLERPDTCYKLVSESSYTADEKTYC